MSQKQKELAVLRGRICPPRRVAAKGNHQHWTRRLDRFRVKYGLSERDLVNVLGGVWGKSYMHEVLSGTKRPQHEVAIQPFIATQIRTFLRDNRGLDDLEIEREVQAVFKKTKENINIVLTQRVTLSKPVIDFFRLRCDPFTVDPRDKSEVFATPRLNAVLARLIEAVKYQGFAAAIGEVGSGKTILKRVLMGQTNYKLRILWPEFMNMEKVHSGSIASFILRDFGQSAPRDLVHRADKLKKMLGSLSDGGVKVALGFDECHRLHPNLLTALKNFWELGSGGFDRYLGLVLFGQPQFEGTLESPEFREITERLDIIRMPKLGKNAPDYLSHRLRLAGRKIDELFEPAAVNRLTKLADTPLALGNLANASLLKAFSITEKRVLAASIPENGKDPQVRAIRSAQK